MAAYKRSTPTRVLFLYGKPTSAFPPIIKRNKNMKWLTTNLIKRNSRIEVDDEDDLLDLWGESAEQQVLNDTGRTYEELVEMGGGTFPADLVHASLLLTDAAYNQRSAVDKMAWYMMPYGYERKIKPYVRLADRKATSTSDI